MANNKNQKSRLLAVLRMLQAETDLECGLTMPQIIERLEGAGIAAERKAVYRDIAALCEAGFDVRKLPTRPVQYALLRSELGIDDVMMLVDVVQSSPFLTERKSNQLVRSLKGLVSEREQKSLAKRVHVQGRIRNQNDSIFNNVDRIHEAMQARRKIEFLYFSYGTDLERRARHDGRRYVVTPVKVVYADSNYYLVAFDEKAGEDGEMRTYRIDRMQIAQISDERATRNAEIANYSFDEFDYLSFGMFSGDPKRVKLRVEAAMMDAIVDRFGRDIEVLAASAERADVRVSVQVSPQFFGWVAGLDGRVKICGPKKVAEDYREWLKGLAAE